MGGPGGLTSQIWGYGIFQTFPNGCTGKVEPEFFFRNALEKLFGPGNIRKVGQICDGSEVSVLGGAAGHEETASRVSEIFQGFGHIGAIGAVKARIDHPECGIDAHDEGGSGPSHGFGFKSAYSADDNSSEATKRLHAGQELAAGEVGFIGVGES